MVSEELRAVLISFDGDFEKISPRVPSGHRTRFRNLSRIWMRCGEPGAAGRLHGALDFVMTVFVLAETPPRKMRLWIGSGYLRTER